MQNPKYSIYTKNIFTLNSTYKSFGCPNQFKTLDTINNRLLVYRKGLSAQYLNIYKLRRNTLTLTTECGLF